MLRSSVVCLLAWAFACAVQPASAATRRACPKPLGPGSAVIPGESWFVKGTTCANGKKVLRRYNSLARNDVSRPKPYGYRCAPLRRRSELISCRKGTRRVDFWPAVSSDTNG
jgi:hypothetical protein